MNEKIWTRLTSLVIAALAAAVLSSCETYQVPITYADPATVQPGPDWIDLGRFVDARDEQGVSLGSIKNEVGIPIKTLVTRKPVAELVHNAVGYGLRARGMLAEKGRGRYIIGGQVTELYAHQLASQEAGCTIRFEVVSAGNSAPVFAKSYHSQLNRRTPKVSYFGDVDEVAEVTSAALQDVIDQMLDDPEFRRALR